MSDILKLHTGEELLHNLDKRSVQRLVTCTPQLIRIVCRVSLIFPIFVVCGHRDEADQNNAYEKGNTKVKWPNSRHNTYPAKAVDVMPKELTETGGIRLNWSDLKRFYFLAGHMRMAAHQEGFEIRWGGDWDMDTEIRDNTFNDLVHFEQPKSKE